jgi:subtilisin family serine protease
MKRKAILAIVFVMLATMFPVFAPKATALFSGTFQPDVSDGLINILADSKPGESVDVIVWSDKKIEQSLKLISDKVTSHEKFGCYVVSIKKEMLGEIEMLPGVVKITENYKISSPKVKISEPDEDTDSNWGLKDLGIQKLWDKGLTGKGVRIGLLDSGVDADHPALKGKIEQFVMFEVDGKKVDSKPFDNVGHGTHCAGIICGSDPKKKNGPGVAPDAKLVVGAVLPGGNGTFAQVLGGMSWILDPDGNPATDDAPSIVSMSLGGMPDPEMTEIADKFQRQGVCLVASSGNEGSGMVGSPGSIPSVFAAGSYDKNRKIAYSSSGAVIDWEMDPYHDLTVIKPDIAAPGVRIYSSYPGGDYVEMSGTSMACPHVAGSAALLLQAQPDLSSTDIGSVLSKTADDLGLKGWDIRWGSGALNINKAVEYLPKLATVKLDVSEKTEQPLVIKIGDRIVRLDGSTTFHVDPGDVSIKIDSFGCAPVEKKLTLKAGAEQKVAFDATKLPTVTYRGSLVGVNGENAIGTIKIDGAPKVFSTDEIGDFEIELPKTQLQAEFWAIGFKPVRMKLEMSSSPDKIIKLKPVKTLMATSQLTTPNGSLNRRFDKFCYKAMDDLGIEYCPVNPRQFKLNYNMIKQFDRVYWFAGEASLKLNDANMLYKYLQNGGKLLMSGRNLLYYEVYRREHNFVQYHFQVRSFQDDTLTTTTVGLPKDQLGDGLALSLSGGDGATNQMGYDTFSVSSKQGNVKPFMAVLTPSDKNLGDYGYTGVRIINPTYLGIYLSFGLEGVGNKDGRLELLKRIDNWFGAFGGLDATFVDDKGKPVFTKISIDEVPEMATDDEGKIKLYYLPQGQVTIKASSLGFDTQTFNAEVVAGKIKTMQFQLANPKKITISGQVTDPETKLGIACQIKALGRDEQVFKTDADGKFSITLPKFAYSFKFFKKGYKNATKQYTESTENQVVNLGKSGNTIAFVQQTTPSWELMAFAGIAQTYDRIARSSGFALETITIPAKGTIGIEDLEQYESIIWYSGFNDEIGGDWWFDVITQFVKNGGKLALIGEMIPSTLMQRPELAKLLGVELEYDDTEVYSIKGVEGDPIGGGMLFSLWHPYIRSGFIATSPSMKAVGKGVSCFNLLGSGSIGIRVKTDKQSTIVLGFGFEQMFTSIAEDKILFTRIVEYLK